MRILLVAYDNGSYSNLFPMGLGALAAALEPAGHEVVIYSQDIHHWPEEHLTAYLDENEFDVVGVSVIAGYYQFAKLLKISEAINRSRRRPIYILGGYGPTPEPEYFLKKTQADFIVLGEGEVTAVELLERLSDKRDITDVQGIAWREGNKFSVNDRRELIPDLDKLPWPAYHLFSMDVYRLARGVNASGTDFFVPVMSGRGCTFKCTFCYRMDTGHRARSPENLVQEMKFLNRDYGITYVGFYDDLLMTSVQHTEAVCKAIIDAKLDMKWNCNGRLNYCTPDLLKLMKQAGCVFINFGIESMDDTVLRNMKKGLRTEQIIKGVEETLAAGINPGLNIIFGNIGDTRETLQKSVDFLLKYDDFAKMRTIRPVTPYPGSPLYYEAISRGLLKDVADFYENKHLNSDLLCCNFTEMSDEDIYEALRLANRQLMDNYFSASHKRALASVDNLYLNRDSNFRGFRQLGGAPAVG
ncbi:Radical SAM domain protein [Rhodospirillaceae bacterium LM-1]|nr:Radical SAM domain protein [Rhodospirillaceae bacterium LM-1]